MRLTVTYAAGHDQVHDGLTDAQLDQGTGAFLSDLLHLKGEGIKRLVVETDEAARERAADAALAKAFRDHYRPSGGGTRSDDPGCRTVRFSDEDAAALYAAYEKYVLPGLLGNVRRP